MNLVNECQHVYYYILYLQLKNSQIHKQVKYGVLLRKKSSVNDMPHRYPARSLSLLIHSRTPARTHYTRPPPHHLHNQQRFAPLTAPFLQRPLWKYASMMAAAPSLSSAYDFLDYVNASPTRKSL